MSPTNVMVERADVPALPGPLAPSRKSCIRVGTVAVSSRFFLAPLAGYTNLAFRRAVRELGGLGLATSDLVNARALLHQSPKTLDLIRTCPADRPLAMQIYGNELEVMCQAARWLEAYGVSTIDINMGCPVHKITRNGGGSALFCQPAGTIALVESIVRSVTIPVTVKMRLGWDDESQSAPYFAREFENAGVAAITIHGRTRAQGFSGAVDLDGIRAVVEAVRAIPVIGNGDVRSIEDAARMFQVTGCWAIAIGRGALMNPWIFSQLEAWHTGRPPPPTPGYQERLRFMARHYRYLLEDRGERLGCLLFRKVANWYCRVLKPGREIQQRLIRLSSAMEFEEIVAMLEVRGEPPNWGTELQPGNLVHVPQGPIEHW